MSIEWKTCFRLTASLFILYLCINYWNPLVHVLFTVTDAAMPLILGAAIAYLLNIFMSKYETYYFTGNKSAWVEKSRRPVCMVLAVLTLIGVVVVLLRLVLPELFACVRLVVKKIPGTLDILQKNELIHSYIPADIVASLEGTDWNAVYDKAAHILTSGLGTVAEMTITAVSSIFSLAVTLLLAIIFSLYLLSGKDKIAYQLQRIMKHYMPKKWDERIRYVMGIVNDCFHRYIVGQMVEAVILGSICTVGMFLLRLPYASMIGALVGFTALIPVAGAYIGAVVGAFMILTVSIKQAIVFVVFLVILQQVEGNLIYPKVVGDSIGLPGIWVLAAVTIGGSLFGILGMLLGVPLTAALYQIVRLDLEKHTELHQGSGTKEVKKRPAESLQQKGEKH